MQGTGVYLMSDFLAAAAGILMGIGLLLSLRAMGKETHWGNDQWDDAQERRNGDE